MDCTIATLIACFGWSNFYIDGGLQVQDAGVYQSYESFRAERTIIDGQERKSGWTDAKWQSHTAENPYGRIALGYEVRFESVLWRIEAAHLSSLSTALDRGVNSLSISARWYPFR